MKSSTHPPWAFLLDVVRTIQCVDNRRHRGRRTRHGQQDTECQQAGVVAVGNLRQLVCDDLQRLRRHHPAERSEQVIDQCGDWKITREGDEEQQRRKQCEEKVLRDLSAAIARQLSFQNAS